MIASVLSHSLVHVFVVEVGGQSSWGAELQSLTGATK